MWAESPVMTGPRGNWTASDGAADSIDARAVSESAAAGSTSTAAGSTSAVGDSGVGRSGVAVGSWAVVGGSYRIVDGSSIAAGEPDNAAHGSGSAAAGTPSSWARSASSALVPRLAVSSSASHGSPETSCPTIALTMSRSSGRLRLTAHQPSAVRNSRHAPPADRRPSRWYPFNAARPARIAPGATSTRVPSSSVRAASAEHVSSARPNAGAGDRHGAAAAGPVNSIAPDAAQPSAAHRFRAGIRRSVTSRVRNQRATGVDRAPWSNPLVGN